MMGIFFGYPARRPLEFPGAVEQAVEALVGSASKKNRE
jgi:hypothetical protein